MWGGVPVGLGHRYSDHNHSVSFIAAYSLLQIRLIRP